jgi:two-component system chemotaxis sensor kinase CheA
MDVVRRNIEKLRGKVVIQSEPGRGSTFTIHLPLTLAIIDGLIVVVGEHRCIIPALSVRESFRPTSEMIATVHERAEMVNVRGSLIPLIRLHEFFGVANAMQDPTQGIVVVVESDDSLRCLLVDRLVGKQEVVIKSLGELFKGKNTLAGAAILGDGRAGLILDVGGLMRPARPGLAQAA